ncbi:MAG: flavin reductase family protein [Deltaproteobacteria bacterium]|jgi:flavin reductase (DIM6/NTAB) family NADH-FMN oxidoreductase RutF|nr:flavin reductase family protein [Deltaproteobacteria bacterium]
MQKIPLDLATRTINCGPVLIIGTKGKNYDDFSAVAWNMPLNKEPSKVAICVGPSHQTWTNIEQYGKFSCNIPGLDLIPHLAYFGGVSGKDTDKLKESSVELFKPDELPVPALKKALAVLICEVIEMDKETHIITAEVTLAFAKGEYFSDHWTGKEGVFPVNHLGGPNYQCGGKLVNQSKLKSW